MKVVSILIAILVALIAGVYVIGPAVAEHFVFKNDPESRRQFKDWKSERIQLPAEALTAKPFSASTQAAARTLLEIPEKELHEVNEVRANYERDNRINYGTLGADLQKHEAFTRAFTTLVTQPDYDISVIGGKVMLNEGVIPESGGYMALHNGAKFLRFKALDLAHQGRFAEALNEAERIVLASRVHPYDILISQLIGIGFCSIGTKTWNEVVQQCGDKNLLRQTLERQNALAGSLRFMSGALPLMAVDQIGMLRELKRRGIDMDYQGLSGRELLARASAGRAKYFDTVVRPKIKGDAQALEQLEEKIRGWQGFSEEMGGENFSLAGHFKRLTGPLSWPTIFKIGQPLEAHTRAVVALAKFDLLRLETARKLYTLEHGASPANPADLVPAYLPALPTDRFAEKGIDAYRETTSNYYSIGPDEQDNRLAITYDPTNGTISAGDIALK